MKSVAVAIEIQHWDEEPLTTHSKCLARNDPSEGPFAKINTENVKTDQTDFAHCNGEKRKGGSVDGSISLTKFGKADPGTLWQSSRGEFPLKLLTRYPF